eukprot:5727561-Pyramimonas_sp.AAC.2
MCIIASYNNRSQVCVRPAVDSHCSHTALLHWRVISDQKTTTANIYGAIADKCQKPWYYYPY